MSDLNNWNKKYSEQRISNSLGEYLAFSYTNPTIKAISIFINKPLRILEIGCGTGELISYIKSNYENIEAYGLDYSDISIKNCKDYSKKFNIQINYVVGDVKSIPFPDEYFDIVFGDQVIGHIDDRDVALREIRRVLKSNGILALTIPNSLRPDGWFLYKFLTNSNNYKQTSISPYFLNRLIKINNFTVIKNYGDILILFRNIKLFIDKFKKNTSNVKNLLIQKDINSHNKKRNILKVFYDYLDNKLPYFTKVTIGVIAKK